MLNASRVVDSSSGRSPRHGSSDGIGTQRNTRTECFLARLLQGNGVGEQSITCKGVRGVGFKPQCGTSDTAVEDWTRGSHGATGPCDRRGGPCRHRNTWCRSVPCAYAALACSFFCIIVQRQRDSKVPESKEKTRRSNGRKQGENKEEKKTRAPNTSSRARLSQGGCSVLAIIVS